MCAQKTLNLAYVHNMRFPTEKAHGYQIAKMCEAFAEKGLEVKLFIPHRKNSIQQTAFEYYSVKKNFHIVELPTWDALSSSMPRVLAFFVNSISMLWSCFRLKLDPSTLVYARTPELAWLFSWRGYRSVFECHQLPKRWAWLYRVLIKRAELVVAITHGLKDDLITEFKLSRRIIVAPDGVDLETFDINIDKERARKELGLPINKKIVVYTGQLMKWKGVHTLAKASEGLENDVLVYFVGGGKKDITDFRAGYPESRFKNITNVNRKEVAIWLKAADVLVIPNSSQQAISERHTSPLKLFEYMASGTPIVASDLPSLREVLNENICFFAKPDDEFDLASAINEALQNPENSKAKSHQAKSLAQNYTWRKRAKSILDLMN